MTPDTYRTGIGVSDLDSITLLGHDLAGDLLGKITFGELAYWLIAKRRPSARPAGDVRGGARGPGRPWFHADGDLGAAHVAQRAGVDTGCTRRRACSAADRASSV